MSNLWTINNGRVWHRFNNRIFLPLNNEKTYTLKTIVDNTSLSDVQFQMDELRKLYNVKYVNNQYVMQLNTNAAIPGENPLTFVAKQSNSSVFIAKENSPTVSGLKYRRNVNDNWTDYPIDYMITLNNVNDYVQFKNAEQTLSTSLNDYVHFVMSGNIEASGNIQSMLNYINTVPDYAFRSLFDGCGALTKAPNLPATVVGAHGYRAMFSKTGITNVPVINCISLGERSFSYMFQNTPIVQAPVLLCTSVAKECYYGMFNSCKNLVVGPELVAPIINYYGCYQQMFSGCTKLSSIKVCFVNWYGSQQATSNWMSNVSATGTFYKLSNLNLETGNNRIPSGWDVVDYDVEQSKNSNKNNQIISGLSGTVNV